MNRAANRAGKLNRRVKQMLMVCCAVILFVLGVWLLVAPMEARGATVFQAGGPELLLTAGGSVPGALGWAIDR